MTVASGVISLAKSRSIGRRIVQLEPRFDEVVSKFSPCPIGTKRPRSSNFQSLAESILSQQLSTKAAATIIARVTGLSAGKLDPVFLARTPISALRRAGCSESKSRAIKELATAVADGELPIRSISRKSDEEILKTLLPYHGIGRWTVEMFLIFQLGRLDIWPTGDLGVRRGWEKVHSLKSDIEITELEVAGTRFAPYRSHLAWYCWRAHSIYS